MRRGPRRDQTAFSRLETDRELLQRSSAVAKHVVTYSCCTFCLGLGTADSIAEAHGVTRRIIEVVP